MNKILCLFCIIAIVGCAREEIAPECQVEATVLNMSAVDGCGFVFLTDDGKKYEPFISLPFCGTGWVDSGEPLPKDPMRGFELYHGQRIKFSYEIVDIATNCMMGTVVSVNCITEIEESNSPKF